MVLVAPMLLMKAADDLCTGSEVTSARHTLSAGKLSHGPEAGLALAGAETAAEAEADAAACSDGPPVAGA
jgi:hypothetical protein